MQRVLSTGLWRDIKAHAKKSRCRKVAVAYVTKDLIGFRKGDTLIADASPASISAGHTSAKLLATLHRRGVAVYCCPGLHAKVLLLDEVAVVGSGNMSESSFGTLIEAAVMTDSPHVVSGVDSFIHQLVQQSIQLDREAITALCKIKVTRSGPMTGKPNRPKAKITQLGNQTWLVGVYELLKTTEKEEQWIACNQEKVAEEHGMETDAIGWIKWGKSGALVAKAQPGDQVIQIWRKKVSSKQPSAVLRSVALLDMKRRNGTTYVFLSERKGRKSEITWSKFKKLMKNIGAAPGGINSERILAPDVAEAINHRWKTI